VGGGRPTLGPVVAARGTGAVTDPLQLAFPVDRPFRLLALGAHPDDIEIGAGGLVLRLAAEAPHGLDARWIVMSGDERRADEAVEAARAFAGADVEVRIGGLRDAWFPAGFEAAKRQLVEAVEGFAADLVLAPALHDAHQDHRLLAELAWQVVRTPAIWGYEIPKFEGDLVAPNAFVRLTEAMARRKADLLLRCFPSQGERTWFTAETFLALLRIRGLEARSPEGFAEGFHIRKLVV
jgi:LmbE family N-acetylglucosaminyl deacetylase